MLSYGPYYSTCMLKFKIKPIIFKYSHQNILKKHLCYRYVWASLLTHPITRPSGKFNNYYNSEVVMGINDVVWYLQHGNVIWKYLWFPQMTATVTIHSSVVGCLHSNLKEMPNFRERCMQMKRTLYSQPSIQNPPRPLPPPPPPKCSFSILAFCLRSKPLVLGLVFVPCSISTRMTWAMELDCCLVFLTLNW